MDICPNRFTNAAISEFLENISIAYIINNKTASRLPPIKMPPKPSVPTPNRFTNYGNKIQKKLTKYLVLARESSKSWLTFFPETNFTRLFGHFSAVSIRRFLFLPKLTALAPKPPTS